MSRPARLRLQLVRGSAPHSVLQSGVCNLSALTLHRQSVITERDLVAYYIGDPRCSAHQFRVTPECLARLPRKDEPWGIPFVATVDGEKLFLGVFLRWYDYRLGLREGELPAAANNVPTILIDRRDASSETSPDWLWLDRNFPHRVAAGADPRQNPTYAQTLRSLGLLKPLEDEAWKKPIADWSQPADGTSGVNITLDRSVADYLRSHRRWLNQATGVARRVDDATGESVITSDLDEDFRCRLPLAPGVYRIAIWLRWRARGAPPNLAWHVRSIRPGRWTNVEIRELR